MQHCKGSRGAPDTCISHLIMGPFKVPVVAQEALAWQWGG